MDETNVKFLFMGYSAAWLIVYTQGVKIVRL